MKIEYFIKELENVKQEIEQIKETLALILSTLNNHNNIFMIINEIFQKHEIALYNLFTKAEELEQKIFDLQNK